MGGHEGHGAEQQGRAAHHAGRRAHASLPALLRAHEIGIRASAVGFDWERAADVVAKIEEEVAELREERRAPARPASAQRAEEEMGDLLFAIANLSRKLGIEPESALRKANDKFTRRFSAMESAPARQPGARSPSCSLQEMEDEWSRVKQAEREARRRPGRSVSAPPGERPHVHHAAVRAQRDRRRRRSVLQDARPDGAVAVQHRRVRVPVPVAAAGADDRQVRRRRFEERPRARRRAAVVRRQHHAHAGRPDEPRDSGFGRRLDVAGQHDRHARRTAPRPPPSRRSSPAGVPTRAARGFQATTSAVPEADAVAALHRAPRRTGARRATRSTAAATARAAPARLPRLRADASRATIDGAPPM